MQNKIKKRFFLIVGTAFVLAFLLPSVVLAADRYISTTGDDTGNNCANPGSPCLTLDNAIGNSGPGDIIHIEAGTYVINHQISINKTLTLRGDTSDNTIIDITGDHGFQIDQILTPQPVIIENLHIKATGNVCAIMTRNSFSIIRDSKITNTLGRGVYISGGQVEVYKNTIYATKNKAILINPQMLSPTTKVIIHNNIITASNDHGVFVQEAHDNTIITVSRNLFVGNWNFALETQANNVNQFERFKSSMLVLNNTFVGNQGPVITPDNGEFILKNNIIANNNGDDMFVNFVKLGSQTRSHNVIFNNTANNLVTDPGAINQAPQFVSIDNGTSTGLTTNTLTDNTKNWGVNALQGKFLNPNTGDNRAWFYIIENTNNTLTVKIANPDYEVTDKAAIGNNYIITDFSLAGTSPALNNGDPEELYQNQDATQNTIGHLGCKNDPLPFVTFRTPKNYNPLVNIGVTMEDILVNNISKNAITGYLWSQVKGEAVVLSNNTVIKPTFQTPLAPQILAFKIELTDAANNKFKTIVPINYFLKQGTQINGQGQPFSTIGQALNFANNGDTLNLGEGVHFEENLNINKNVTLKGVSYEKTVIEGLRAQSIMRNGPSNAGLFITAKQNVTFSNLGIFNIAGPAIDVSPSLPNTTTFKIEKVAIEGNQGDGVRGSIQGTFLALGSKIGNNVGSGLNVYAKNIIVKGNRIFGNGQDAVTYPDLGAVEHIEILGNVLANNKSTGLHRTVTKFINNVVTNAWSLNLASSATRGAKILNNTFYGMESVPETMHIAGPAGSGVDFFNNIVVENPHQSPVNCDAGPTYSMDYNLYFNTAVVKDPQCPNFGAHDQVNTAPKFFIALQNIADAVSANTIKKNGANWEPDQYTGSFALIQNKAFLITKNTSDTLTLAIPTGKDTMSVTGYGGAPGDTFKITSFKLAGDSPALNAGLNSRAPDYDIEGIDRLSFGKTDLGAKEKPEFTIKYNIATKDIIIPSSGEVIVPIKLMNSASNNVTVHLIPGKNFTVSKQDLVFTKDNWQTPQNVNFTSTASASQTTDITSALAATVTSNDPNYNNIQVPNKKVIIRTPDAKTDKIQPLVIIKETNSKTTVSFDGLTDNYSVQLTQAPTSSVYINIKTSTSAITTSVSKLFFNQKNWNKPQFVTVSTNPETKDLSTAVSKDTKHYIAHLIASKDSRFDKYKTPHIKVLVYLTQDSAGDTGGAKDQQTQITVRVKDGQCIEGTHDKILALISGKLRNPEFVWKQESGPDMTIDDPQLSQFNDKIKAISKILCPKYSAKNSRAFIKGTVTDGNQTKSATMMLEILPKEKELTKQSTEKVPGKILGTNAKGDMIKQMEATENGKTVRFIMLSKTTKLYINDDSEIQVINIGNHVIVSDYTYKYNSGVLLSFDMTKIKRAEYILNDVAINQQYGITSYIASEKDTFLGYRLDKGDINGDGVSDLWALAPFDRTDGHVIVFNVATLRPIKRYLESNDDEFATIFTAADINGDGKKDLNIGTVRDQGSGVLPADRDDWHNALSSDQILDFLSDNNDPSILDIADIGFDHSIRTHADYWRHQAKSLMYASAGGSSVIDHTNSLDMNIDGFDDVATADSDLIVSVTFGDTDIAEIDPAVNSINLSDVINAIFVMDTGDVTGDGIDDIVLGCNDGIIIIIPGNANLPFEDDWDTDDIIILHTDDGEDVTYIIVADTNGDGVADIGYSDGSDDITTVIDTFETFTGDNGTYLTTSKMNLMGASGCSVNLYSKYRQGKYHHFMVIMILFLSFLLLRINNNRNKNQMNS